MLLELVIRKVTGQKYSSSVDHNVLLSEVQPDAPDITEKLEEVISKTQAEELIDLAEVRSKIFKAMMSGNGNRVPEILRSYVKEACKDNNQLLTSLKNSLEEVLAEKEALNKKQNDVSLSKIPERVPIAQLSKENGPSTLLNGTSITKGIARAMSTIGV